ncbi:MAG: hypothetical protein JW795_09695 [Chitinivibrionales bacterium]|nr:hypothetical protein [Chitinivibrionales bacterium]
MGKYGRFSEDGTEFIIHRPDTPQPWINYSVNGRYHAIISNTGGGFSYFISPLNSRILRRRYNSLPEDRPGRYIYIRDMKTGEYYSPTWQPTLTQLDSYECRHGRGYTRITTSYKGLNHEILYFVPMEADMEIWRVTLKNTTDHERQLSLFPYVELVPGDAKDDLIEQPNGAHFRWAEFDTQEQVIYATNKIGVSFLPPEQQWMDDGCWGKYVYMASTLPVQGYDCNRDNFIGNCYRSESNPLTVEQGALSNSSINSGHACAALQSTVTLKAGEKIEFCIFIGVVDRGIVDASGTYRFAYKEQTSGLLKEWNVSRADQAFAHLKQWYDDFCSVVTVDTPDEKMNRHINVWNKLQLKSTFTISRDASRFHLGLSYGMGFRDTSQDLLGYLMFDAAAAKEVIKEIARQMFPNGYTYHNYFRVQNTGIFTNHSDDPLWLPLAVVYYLRETADFGFLDEIENYADPQKATNVSEFVCNFTKSLEALGPQYRSGGQGTILEHCYRGIEKVWADRSSRNIPLILGGDWNDDLNECGRLGRGESVMVAVQLAATLALMIEVLEVLKRDEHKVKEYKTIYETLKVAINSQCWDGQWYYRFTRDDGRIEGSKQNKQGSMYLEPQPWAVIGGVAEGKRAQQCLDSVLKNLGSDCGPVLCAPEYTISDATIGAATREAPGKKENASIFNHPVTWFIQANTIIGRGAIAFQEYYKTLPENLSADQDRFSVEPYVYPEYTTGPAHKEFGKGGHSWLTGTAPWMFLCGVEFILGVKPWYDGLIIDPCIPKTWDHFSITRKFRNATYAITVKNPKQVEKGVVRVVVDGVAINGNKVKAFNDGATHAIEVTMG